METGIVFSRCLLVTYSHQEETDLHFPTKAPQKHINSKLFLHMNLYKTISITTKERRKPL